MKSKIQTYICSLEAMICWVAATLLFGEIASPAQTGNYLYNGQYVEANGQFYFYGFGSEQNITLKPGLYDITAYGAQGGSGYPSIGALGAEMEAQFSFPTGVNLTILVGGSCDAGYSGSGGGGGGGSFVVEGNTPLLIAGGGGGAGTYGAENGLTGTSGGAGTRGGGAGGTNGYGGGDQSWGAGGGYYGGGDPANGGGGSFLNGGGGGSAGFSINNGGYGGGGGGSADNGYCGGGGGGYSGGGGGAFYGGGGGGGSYIDSSAIATITEISGVASPDDSPNGEIIIIALPPGGIIIQSQPLSQSVAGGQTATLSVSAASLEPLNYQWLFDGTNIANATNSTYRIPDVQTNDDGTYSVLISDTTTNVNSSNAILTVIYPPPVIVSEPSNISIIAGSNALFSVNATSFYPMTFQWQFNGTNLTDGGQILGSTTSNLTISAAEDANSGAYQVIATNAYGATTSSIVSLAVYAPPQIVGQPSSETLLLGANTGFTVTATGYQLNYQWYYNGLPLANNGNISGTTSPTLEINNVQTNNNGVYSVLVTSLSSGEISSNATLTVVSPSPACYVNAIGANPVPPYSSWDTAATNIQDAINATAVGGSVFVTNGVYNSGGYTAPDGTLSAVVVSNAITLQSVNGASSTFINGNSTMRGIYLQTNSVLIGFTVTNGNAGSGSGGGIYCQSDAQIVSNCVIIGNSMSGTGLQGNLSGGGGVYAGTLYNCLIISNSAPSGDGGGDNESVMNDCIIVGNQGDYGGGACQSVINNCTIVGNYSALAGGGALMSDITNSIIYDNSVAVQDGFIQNGPNCEEDTVAYCCTIPSPGGIGIITNAPLFVNEVGGDFHLQSDSPCINMGDSQAVTTTVDFDGNPRVVEGVVDMGAYEFQTPISLMLAINVMNTNAVAGFPVQLQAVVGQGTANTIFWDFGDGTTASNQFSLSHTWSAPGVYSVTVTVSNNFVPQSTTVILAINVLSSYTIYASANGTNPEPPYLSWNSAATNIEDAVNVAPAGSVVLVTNGVYQSSGVTIPPSSGNYYSVALTNAITLQSVNGPGITFIQCPVYGTSSCVFMTNGTVLSGFTLTTNGTSGETTRGIIASPNAVVTNCVITGCSAGGVYSGTLYNCTIAANVNGNFGGGATKSTMFNCIISNNAAQNGGGVIGGILNNCLIVNNTATSEGGGVFAQTGDAVVLNNCVISNNTAGIGGGVNNYVVPTPPFSRITFTNCILNNCILASNTASYQGGGAYCAQMANCLISSNRVTARVSESYPGGGGVESGFLNNCTLIGNSSTGAFEPEGGGADGLAFPNNTVLSNCVLIANSAPQGGGANDCTLIHCTLLQNFVTGSARGPAGIVGGGAASSTLVDCLVISNSEAAALSTIYCGGGGTYACNLTNCILAYNAAVTNGGGANASTIVNCTVVANAAANGGGVLNCTNYNSILYYNTGGDYYPSTPPYLLNFCCTPLAPTNGFRNITTPPLFVNLVGGDFHLQPQSPSINSGNNAYIRSATDFDGNPRIVGGTVDIGAYEYQTPTSVISYAYLQQYGLPTDGSVDFADLDGTAFNVYQDWIAGLNPTNPASVLAMLTPVTTNTSAGIKVSWQSVAGIPYFLQRSTNLIAQPPFTTIQSNITGQTNTTSYIDTTATGNVPYFYRVGVIAP